MPAFTPDVVRSLPATDTSSRLAAFERFAATPPPTPDSELWRYSRITELHLDRFGLGNMETTISGAEAVQTDEPVPAALDDELPELDLFAELNRALMTPIHLRVPRGHVVAEPVVITHTLTQDGTACFPRLVIDAGEDSEITVIERFLSPESVTGVVLPVLRVRAAQAAA